MADKQLAEDLRVVSEILDATLDDFVGVYATGEHLDDVTLMLAQMLTRDFADKHWQLALVLSVAIRRLAV